MKTLTTFLLVALASFLIGGCSLLGDPIADKVAGAIDKYCEEPQGARELYRQTINAELQDEGHSIQVTCLGDDVQPTSWLQFDTAAPQLGHDRNIERLRRAVAHGPVSTLTTPSPDSG